MKRMIDVAASEWDTTTTSGCAICSRFEVAGQLTNYVESLVTRARHSTAYECVGGITCMTAC